MAMDNDTDPAALARLVWELEQRRLITDTLTAYCTLVDRNDPAALVERVFSEDGCVELGARHAVVGRTELIKLFARTLAGFEATSHHLSNVVIDLHGDDSATATSSVYAWHRTVDGRRVEAWGRYADRLQLGPDGWRIAVRRLSMAGSDGWRDAPFEQIERLPNPSATPAPTVLRR